MEIVGVLSGVVVGAALAWLVDHAGWRRSLIVPARMTLHELFTHAVNRKGGLGWHEAAVRCRMYLSTLGIERQRIDELMRAGVKTADSLAHADHDEGLTAEEHNELQIRYERYLMEAILAVDEELVQLPRPRWLRRKPPPLPTEPEQATE